MHLQTNTQNLSACTENKLFQEQNRWHHTEEKTIIPVDYYFNQGIYTFSIIAEL